MADVQESVSVQAEVQSICLPLVQAAKDLKAKNPSATLIADGSGLLLALLQGYGALAADIKTAETQIYLCMTVGKILAVFTGAV